MNLVSRGAISRTDGATAFDCKVAVAQRSQTRILKILHISDPGSRKTSEGVQHFDLFSVFLNDNVKQRSTILCSPAALCGMGPRGHGQGLRTARPLKWTQQTSKTSRVP